MNADQSDSLAHQIGDRLGVALEQRMAAPPSLKNNMVPRGKRPRRNLRASHCMHHRADGWNFIQARFQQQTTGTIFMLAWPWLRAGNKNDFFGVGGKNAAPTAELRR